MADLKNSFDKYSEQADDAKNKDSNDLLKKIEDYATSVGAKTKAKFTPALPKIKIPSSLQGLLDQFGNKLNSYLQSKINDVKRLAKDTVRAAINTAKDFAYNLAKKGIDMIASRLYLPEEVYLAHIIPYYYTGQDLRYNNDAVRKIILTKDMPKTLKWINQRIGVSYTVDQPNQASSDLYTLVRHSAIESIDYVLGDIKNEVDMLTTIRDTYEKGSSEYTRYNNNVIKGKKFICKWFKEMLVYSVGNLNIPRLEKFINKYNISPRMLGTTDEEYYQSFKINSSDIDIIAPFWERNEYGYSFIKDHDLINKGKLPKYIVLRNIYFKYIYVYLVDKGIFPKKTMYNIPLYERLCYPTMDALTEALDNALKNVGGLTDFFNRDKIYTYTMQVKDTLKDPMNVVYAQLVSYGQVLPAPSLDETGSFIPPPSSTSGNNSGDSYWRPDKKPKPGNNLDDESFDSLTEDEKIDFIGSLFSYYFKFIEVNEHYKVLKPLFDDIEKGYKDKSDDKKSYVYYKLLITYITPLYGTSDFDYDLYWQNVIATSVKEKYVKLMIDIRLNASLDKYYSDASEKVKKEFLDLFIKHYKFLKETMYKSVVSQYSQLEVFEMLVFANTVFKNEAPKYLAEDPNGQYRREVINKWEEFFPNAYQDPSFDIRNYLKTLNDTNRRTKVLEIIQYCDLTLTNIYYPKTMLKNIHEKILIEFLPAYEYIINATGSKDINIDDPSIRDLIREQIEYDKSNWTILIDFDNKIVTEETVYEYDDLNQTYPYWEKLHRND